MSKENEQPGGDNPAGTGGNPSPEPTATPEPKKTPTATVDPSKVELPEGYELIKTEDKRNLISARDRAKNDEGENSQVLNALIQKDAVRDAMSESEFQEKYPDVTEAEILEANPMSDEEIVEIAKRKQQRYDKVKLDHLKKVQSKTGAPEISAADRDEQLKALKKPSTNSRFSQALRLKRLKVK